MNDLTAPSEGATCGVCRRLIEDPETVNLCGIVLEPNDPMKKREPELQGTLVEIRFVKTPDLKAAALYTPRGSDARKAGLDLVFLCCSEECGVKLSEAIVTDATMFSKLALQ